jgi:signal transduction histidine kinase
VHIDELGASVAADAATALFRVAQEALANVHRHSGSAWARLSLRRAGSDIELIVEDGGRGMPLPNEGGPAEAPAIGVGISGMRLRIEQLGGRLELRRRRPGLAVRAVLPSDAG